MDWIRDNYYTTRAGEKVRLICTDAPNEYRLVFLTEDGGIFHRTKDGRGLWESQVYLDITGPWVEPVKPLECWANVYGNTPGKCSEIHDSKREAEYWATKDGAIPSRIAVHMREVLP